MTGSHVHRSTFIRPEGGTTLARKHLHTDWITARATQIIVALIVLAPALDVMLGGRSLQGDDISATVQGTAPLPIMTLATMVVMVLSLLIIARGLMRRTPAAPGLGVMAAFALFFVTNTLLCVPFADNPWITRSHIYPVILFLAIYMARNDGTEVVIDAMKWSLLAMMAASLACMVLLPDVTRRVYAAEIRLPFIDFRLWGLGAHANAIGPLALLSILVTLNRPFNRLWLTRLSLACAGLVLLLAQSQTAWLIGLVVIPGYLAYQNPEKRARMAAVFKNPAIYIPLGLALIVLSTVYSFSTLFDEPANVSTPAGGGAMLTGRLNAWQVAIDTFEQYPLFGYGLTAWNDEFRANVYLPWATHAHNQLLQSLSVAGLFGAFGLIVYVIAMVRGSFRVALATKGLSLAVMFVIMIRTLTEVPLEIGAILLGDVAVHLLLFRLVTAPLSQTAASRKPAAKIRAASMSA